MGIRALNIQRKLHIYENSRPRLSTLYDDSSFRILKFYILLYNIVFAANLQSLLKQLLYSLRYRQVCVHHTPPRPHLQMGYIGSFGLVWFIIVVVFVYCGTDDL